jgi:hypothetical protein
MNRVRTSLLGIALFLTLAPTLPASTLYVNGISGNNANDCKSPTTACKTIGHAITRAGSGDSIMVAPATYTENLTLNISLTVIGSSASTTIVDGGGVSAVFTISSTAKVSLSELTIRNGRAPNGGGIDNNGALTINSSTISGNKAAVSCSASFCDNSGGGIYNNGALTINNSIMSGNEALIQCTNQCATLGGGIFNNSGTLAITNSTISGNSASASCPPREFCHSDGGGIFVANGTMTISDSTISGNSANEAGGIDNRGTLSITNSTVSGNTASFRFNAFGGGISNGGKLAINNSTISGNSAHGGQGSFGGGIDGTATLQNSIVANSSSGGNCSGTMTSHGYNLSSDGTCNFKAPGDLNNHDPLLGPLQNNGGPTETMALLPGSPAIDSGNPSGCTDGQGHLLKTDQRGMPRPDREDSFGCDMGAYERQSD